MFGTTIRQTFQDVRQFRKVKTFCTGCKKKLVRTISTTYYRNGFHNESETRAKNDKWLDKEAKKLARIGTTCSKCES